MKSIKLTNKQYEVVRQIIRTLVKNQNTRKSYTKHLHKSRKNEKFEISVCWKAVSILSHIKEFK